MKDRLLALAAAAETLEATQLDRARNGSTMLSGLKRTKSVGIPMSFPDDHYERRPGQHDSAPCSNNCNTNTKDEYSNDVDAVARVPPTLPREADPPAAHSIHTVYRPKAVRPQALLTKITPLTIVVPTDSAPAPQPSVRLPAAAPPATGPSSAPGTVPATPADSISAAALKQPLCGPISPFSSDPELSRPAVQDIAAPSPPQAPRSAAAALRPKPYPPHAPPPTGEYGYMAAAVCTRTPAPYTGPVPRAAHLPYSALCGGGGCCPPSPDVGGRLIGCGRWLQAHHVLEAVPMQRGMSAGQDHGLPADMLNNTVMAASLSPAFRMDPPWPDAAASHGGFSGVVPAAAASAPRCFRRTAGGAPPGMDTAAAAEESAFRRTSGTLRAEGPDAEQLGEATALKAHLLLVADEERPGLAPQPAQRLRDPRAPAKNAEVTHHACAGPHCAVRAARYQLHHDIMAAGAAAGIAAPGGGEASTPPSPPHFPAAAEAAASSDAAGSCTGEGCAGGCPAAGEDLAVDQTRPGCEPLPRMPSLTAQMPWPVMRNLGPGHSRHLPCHLYPYPSYTYPYPPQHPAYHRHHPYGRPPPPPPPAAHLGAPMLMRAASAPGSRPWVPGYPLPMPLPPCLPGHSAHQRHLHPRYGPVRAYEGSPAAAAAAAVEHRLGMELLDGDHLSTDPQRQATSQQGAAGEAAEAGEPAPKRRRLEVTTGPMAPQALCPRGASALGWLGVSDGVEAEDEAHPAPPASTAQASSAAGVTQGTPVLPPRLPAHPPPSPQLPQQPLQSPITAAEGHHRRLTVAHPHPHPLPPPHSHMGPPAYYPPYCPPQYLHHHPQHPTLPLPPRPHSVLKRPSSPIARGSQPPVLPPCRNGWVRVLRYSHQAPSSAPLPVACCPTGHGNSPALGLGRPVDSGASM